MQGTVTDDKRQALKETFAKPQINDISKAIAEKVGQQKYRIWFKNSTRLTFGDGYLKVGVPNLFIASWIENHFLNEINQAVQLVSGSVQKVTFVIDPELSGNVRRRQLDSQAQSVESAQNRPANQR